MTDINKQIEEEAKKILLKANKLPPEANYFGSVDHIKYSANEILKLSEELKHSSRWRKVSEGLPEVKDKPYIVAIRVDKTIYDIVWIVKENGSVKKMFDFYGVIEWKPID